MFVRLTPLASGEDLTREFRLRDQRDPEKLLRELGPASPGKLRLAGTYYTVAVNAAGKVCSSFYEPWEGGRYWGCWRPHAKVTCRRQADTWRVELTLPLEHFQPLLSRGAVWGLDLYRHRPARGGAPEQLIRTRHTILLQFDGDGREIERRLLAGGVDEASVGKWAPLWARTDDPKPEHAVARLNAEPVVDAWPSESQWQSAAPLRPFREVTNGRTAAEQTRVRLLYGESHLFARFDCDRSGLQPLRVVTRKDELAAYEQA